MSFGPYYYRALAIPLFKPLKILSFYRLATGVKRIRRSLLLNDRNTAPPPLSIAIAVTYKCNLRCVQCYQWGRKGWLKDSTANASKELSTEHFIKFIDDVAPFRPYIQFSGGEPLLRDDLFELVKYASKKGLLTSIATNGVLLEKKAHDIIKSGTEYLYVSLDGPPEDINSQIRGELSSQKTVRGIKMIIDMRKKMKSLFPMVEVRTTLINENREHLYSLAKYLEREVHPDVFCIMPECFLNERMYKDTLNIFINDLHISPRALEGQLRSSIEFDGVDIDRQIKDIKALKARYKLRLCEPIEKNGFSFNRYYNEPEKMLCDITFCGALYAFSFLEPNGNIAPCSLSPDYIAGNILDNGFMEIWNGEKYRKMREFNKRRLLPVCSRCRHIYRFNGYYSDR